MSAQLSASQGVDELRREALQRLSAHIEARQIEGGSLAWADGRGSMAAGLIDSDDPEQWEAQLGLPRWMAYLIDALARSMPVPRTLEVIKSLFDAMPPGSDTQTLGSRLIITLLDDAGAGLPLPRELADAMALVRGLHGERLSGVDVAPANWKQARRAAVLATDHLAVGNENEELPPETIRLRAVGSVIESAGWDPGRSAISVSEVLQQWLDLASLDADRDFGWTREDDARIRALLSEMNDRYIAPNPEEERDVYQLLEAHHPEIEARLRAYVQHCNTHGWHCAERAAALLLEQMEKAT